MRQEVDQTGAIWNSLGAGQDCLNNVEEREESIF